MPRADCVSREMTERASSAVKFTNFGRRSCCRSFAGLAFQENCRRRFFQTYEQRKATVVTHPVFGYKMSYGRMIEVQARMLAAHIRGDIPAYTGFTVR